MNKSNEIWRVEINGHTLETDLAALKVMICQGEITANNKVAKGSLASIEAGRVPVLRRVFSGEETLESIISEAAAAASEPAFGASPLPVSPFAPAVAPQVSAFTDAPDGPSVAVATMPEAAAVTPEIVAPEPLTVWTNTVSAEFAVTPENAQEQVHEAVVWQTPAANDAQTEAETLAPETPANDWQQPADEFEVSYFGGAAEPSATDCFNHPQTPPKFVCRDCGALACKDCVKKIGTVALCLRCGEMCHEYTVAQQRAARQAGQASGFGFADFGLALAYPFKNAVTLLGAAIFYGVLLLAGWQARIVAFGLMLGFITRVIKQISVKGPEAGGVFSNDDFSVMDDIFAPIVRGVCVTLVTYGPLLALVIMLVMGTIGGVSLTQQQNQQQQQAAEQQMNDLREVTAVEGDPVKQAEAMKRLDPANAARYSEGQAAPGPTNTAKSDTQASLNMLLPMLQMLGGGIIIAFLLALLWAFFYYPVALMIAGFTQSAGATLNPLVGLSTIWHLGVDYLKIFAMYVVVAIAVAIANATSYKLLADFTMPFIGNLPATFVDGVITFYGNMVLACILGLALYKCADKLDLTTD